MLYLITYIPFDFQKVNTSIIEKIKTYSNYVILNTNNFIIRFKIDEKEEDNLCIYLRNELKIFINKGDTLLVSELSGHQAWTGLHPDISSWLKEKDI